MKKSRFTEEQIISFLLIKPFYPVVRRGRRPYPPELILRVHLMQNWFARSDPAMEEALYEIASLRSFARLRLSAPIPDETTILNFRHLLEEHELAEDILKLGNAHLARKGLLLKRGSIVDATIIAAPSSTKNAEGKRDPEMHQTRKGNQWHFGIKAHIGVDADSGLVRGLRKKTSHLLTLFALSNLWMVRQKFLNLMGVVRLQTT